MRKVFLDTNIWLRFLLRDNEQAEDCTDLVRQIESGKFAPYISPIVLLEINFVLTFTYKYTKKRSCSYLEGILKTRNLTVIDKTSSSEAIDVYAKYNIKFTDCLIATQIPPKTVLVTYDREFRKIPDLSVKAPKEVLGGLKS